jgi:agmatine deiminase
MPAEWTPHAAAWLAWPSHPAEWPDVFDAVRREHADLCRAIADHDAAGVPREPVRLLVLAGESEASARAALGDAVAYERLAFGDVWLRDTGPIWVEGPRGLEAARFGWNGWGGKYHFPDDDGVGDRIAAATATPTTRYPIVLEGGALEVDGEGTLLTTVACVLDPKRNPGLGRADADALLGRALGATRIHWLDATLINDHTDGHIDTLARFPRPGQVLCMRPGGADDPNAEVLARLERDLGRLTDAGGRRLDVVTLPSPGLVADPDGAPIAASYVNYYVANSTVVVPTYGVPNDEVAVATIQRLYPGRRAVGRSARAIATGGGAFHCITQQQPIGAAR